jgi:transmembrane sensor
MELPYNILQLAFDLKKGEPLSEEQQAICDEWSSGRALEYMQIHVGDPRLVEYLALYKQYENKTAVLYEKHIRVQPDQGQL